MEREITQLFSTNPSQCIRAIYDFIMKLEIQNGSNQFIGVFGAPRSASNFVTHTISIALDCKQVNVTIYDELAGHDVLHTVNEIDYLKLLSFCTEKHIIHTHIVANPLTLRAIERLKVIPIVTRRSIPDSLISIRYEIERQWTSLLEYIRENGFASTFFGPVSSRTIDKFLSNSFEYQMDFIIDVCAPWYFLFHESWETAKEKGIDVYFVDYENIISDQSAVVRDLLRHLNYHIEDDQIEKLVHFLKTTYKRNINLRVGKSGTGKKEMKPNQMDKLRKIGANFGYDLDKFTV